MEEFANQLEQLKSSIEEIKTSQQRITAALLGSYEKNSIGLIEESRNLRKGFSELDHKNKIHDVQIGELMEFKNTAKRIVVGIALVVPFLFEFFKVAGAAVWEALKFSK